MKLPNSNNPVVKSTNHLIEKFYNGQSAEFSPSLIAKEFCSLSGKKALNFTRAYLPMVSYYNSNGWKVSLKYNRGYKLVFEPKRIPVFSAIKRRLNLS